MLELMLGYVIRRADTKPLAKELLDRFETLPGVFAARSEDLRSVKGFGPALESFWVLWREMWARLGEAPLKEKQVLASPQAVAEMAMGRLGAKTAEEFWIALVDSKIRLVGWEKVAQGTVDQAAVYVREIMELALRFKASGVFLVHNHPGGDPAPSAEDEQLTARVIQAGRSMNVRVLDHVIVAEDRYFSFQEQGFLDE